MDSHREYVQRLTTFLRTHYPLCIPIPSRNNMHPTSTKTPAWSFHVSIPADDLWARWERAGMGNCTGGIVLTLRSGLIVVDVDSKEAAAALETCIPSMTDTAIQETKKGRHYFFRATDASNRAGIYDSARGLVKRTTLAKHLGSMCHDGSSAKLPIDIKTTCTTGTGGIISIAPCANKKWHDGKALFEHPPADLPDELLAFIVANRASTAYDHASSEMPPDVVSEYDALPPSASRTPSVVGSVATTSVLQRPAMTEHELIECLATTVLSPARATNYSDWVAAGMALYNACTHPDEFLNAWLAFSSRCTDPTRLSSMDECKAKWTSFGSSDRGPASKRLSVGSLRFWSQQDNPEEYRAVASRSARHLLFQCDSTKHHAMATLMYMLYGAQFVCTSIKGRAWYRFDGHRWARDEDGHTLRRLMSTEVAALFLQESEQLYRRAREVAVAGLSEEEVIARKQPILDRADRMAQVALRLDNKSFKELVFQECADRFFDQSFSTRLDTKPHLLGFENGIFDLDALVFRAGRPDDFVTMSVRYDFPLEDDAGIQAQLAAFMSGTQASEQLAQYVMGTLAYTLHGRKYMELLWFLTGSKGRNGKSLLLNTLMAAALGDYHYAPDPSVLMSSKFSNASGPSPEVVKLAGKRLVAVSEPDNAGESTFRASRLKAWRGNDFIQARGLYQDVARIKPQFALFVLMNERPPMDKMDNAVASTLRIVEFPWEFVSAPALPHQRQLDASLKPKFEEESVYAAQFMRMLLRTYRELQPDVFGPCKHLATPEEVLTATQQYVEEHNALGDWLDTNFERVDPDPDLKTDYETADCLRRRFNEALRRRQERPMGRTAFKEAMAHNGFHSVKASVTGGAMTYFGLRPRAYDSMGFDPLG
jgi:phage/plasmid-associated DNA primase